MSHLEEDEEEDKEEERDRERRRGQEELEYRQEGMDREQLKAKALE